MLDGNRITQLIIDAQTDYKLRSQLYYCPEKAVEGRGLSKEETEAILFGDLSQIDLSPDILKMGHTIFNDAPFGGDMPPFTALDNAFLHKSSNDPCI